MLESELPRPRFQLRDPIRQVRRRIEPRGLGDPFQMHERPEIVAPKRHQFEAARRNRLGVRNDVAATFGEILGLKIGADEDRRIVMHGSHHFSVRDHVSAKAAVRSGEDAARPDEMSRTPGLSQSPSGRMITYGSLSSVMASALGSISSTISV